MLEVVGNDVVDLTGHHRRERFVARVCHADERTRVAGALDLWQLFAAKEAAYKAVVKLGAAPGFAHGDFRVAADLRSVRWRELELRLGLTWDGDHVHAVAWSRGAREPAVAVTRADGAPGDLARVMTSEAASRLARSLACGLVAQAIGCDAAGLTVVRDAVSGAWDGYGPPRVERVWSHRRTSVSVDADVSLSHDGPFVAAAALTG
jgi:phosphopantetheinyl transferase (holo-ACP synthase)